MGQAVTVMSANLSVARATCAFSSHCGISTDARGNSDHVVVTCILSAPVYYADQKVMLMPSWPALCC